MTRERTPRKRRRNNQLLHPSEALRERMRLVQDLLFGGSMLNFSKAIGVTSGHLAHTLNLNSRVTVNMAAQVVSRTNVNARWLLTGEGPMLADTGPETPERLLLPPVIQSSYPALDPLVGVVPPKRLRKRTPVFSAIKLKPETVQAAKLIYKARLAQKPVTLFLTRECCEAGGLSFVEQLVAAGYVTHVALAGCALPYSLPKARHDTYQLDRVVRLAAVNGVSLGEALSRWAAPQATAVQNVLGLAKQQLAVVTAHVEPGEIPELFQPRTRGAEFGALLGAATYVDSLVFAEQVLRAADKPAGVFLVAHDQARFARLLESAFVALRTTSAAPPLKTCALVTFNAQPQVSVETVLKPLIGKTCHLKSSDGIKAMAELISACHKVYAGLL